MTGSTHNTSARFTVSLDFIQKAFGDCIPDDRMAEVVRRLVAVVPDNIEQDIVRSEEAPTDKSKFWYKPSSKKLFVFNPSTSQWEETNVDNISVCISPESDDALTKDEVGCLLFDPSNLPGASEKYDGVITSDGSGNAQRTISFQNWEDENAAVSVNPKEDLGASARWWVSDRTSSSVTVSFAGLTVSTDYDCLIIAIKTT